MRSIVFLLLFLTAFGTQAANYYVCPTGLDTNPGTQAQPFQTFSKAIDKFNSISGGDSVLLCRGGHFTTTGKSIFNTRCSNASRCTLGDYGTGAKPIVSTTAYMLKFIDGSNATHDEGYTVENIHFKGSGADDGFFLYNDVDYLTIRKNILEGFESAINSSGAGTPDPGSNKKNEHLIFTENLVMDNNTQGWQGGCSDCEITKNRFINNGYAATTLNHNIYLGGKEVNTNVLVDGNYLFKAAVVNGKCQAVSLVVHGNYNGLTISNNVVNEEIGNVTDECWGIAVDPGWGTTDESFTNVNILNNIVINSGKLGIGCASCVNVVISGNQIINNQSPYSFTGIRVPSRTQDTTQANNITITRNTFHFEDPLGKGKTTVNIGSSVVTKLEKDNIAH